MVSVFREVLKGRGGQSKVVEAEEAVVVVDVEAEEARGGRG